MSITRLDSHKQIPAEVQDLAEDVCVEKRDRTHKVSRVTQLDFNQHVAVFDLQRVDSNLRAGILRCLTGFWIPRPTVPWTHYFAAFDHSLPQGAAAMEADIVHGAVGAAHVGDADGLVAAGKFFGFIGGREFGFGGEFSDG